MRKLHYLCFLFLCITQLGWAQTVSNKPPVVTATGDQIYCPLDQINIVTTITIDDPDDDEIEALYIQISTGYRQGQDQLLLTGNHPNIIESWNAGQGKLTLKSSTTGSLATYVDLLAAARDVVFESNSPSLTGERYFSISIGDANYLPSTDHYYEYIPDTGITWTAAKTAAAARTYFGLQGYLATITSAEEAQLSGEQASGAGWIGGSDAATEGVWKWVTGPEAGTTFWNGLSNGSSSNYANWNTNEPNQFQGNEDYAHVTAPGVGITGSWNDLSNTGFPSGNYQPKGYIVEYGSPSEPSPKISASTKITIPSIDTITEGNRCDSGIVMLSAVSSTGMVEWYDAPEGGTLLSTNSDFFTPLLTETTTFYVYATELGCTLGAGTPVTATIHALPNLLPTYEFKNCDEDGTADGFVDFNLNEISEQLVNNNASLTTTYHLSMADANLNSNPIATSPYNNATANTIYVRVENTQGCHITSTINLQVSTTSFSPNFIVPLYGCDTYITQEGTTVFDLTLASTEIINQFPSGQNLSVHYYRNLSDAILEENEINSNNYTNETPFEQTLYVRVESDDNGDCFGIGPHLQLTVYPLPVFNVTEEAFVCTDSFTLLETFNPQGNYFYKWFNPNNELIGEDATVMVSTEGIYTVVAQTENGCESSPITITVTESGVANISQDDIIVSDKNTNNTIAINNENNNLGLGDYDFSLDNPFDIFQDEPLFTRVEPGIHTLYVRDKNGCGISQIDISVIGFPKFFTPNNDTFNETWQVIGITPETYPASELFIYDRYGKFIVQIDPYGKGWDGYVNNQSLPETDYWFKIYLVDQAGNQHNRNGHFALKR